MELIFSKSHGVYIYIYKKIIKNTILACFIFFCNINNINLTIKKTMAYLNYLKYLILKCIL